MNADLLPNYLLSEKDKPFIWGENDCCQFSAKWARISTGVVIESDYSTAKEALKIIKENNGVSGLADKYFKRVDVRMAKRGDIMMQIVDGKREGLGICEGITSVFKGNKELLRSITIECIAAWSLK